MFPADTTNPTYTVGKNAQNNWDIYRAASQTDTIFHLDNQPSPYVIVSKPVDELTKTEIITAAQLCKAKSKFANTSITVMYMSISNTYLGEKVGLFYIKSNSKKKTIVI